MYYSSTQTPSSLFGYLDSIFANPANGWGRYEQTANSYMTYMDGGNAYAFLTLESFSNTGFVARISLYQGLNQSWPVFWSGSTVSNSTLRVKVWVSTGFFFMSIEGPRAGEPGTHNSIYGSFRGYAWLDYLIPYHDNNLYAYTSPPVVSLNFAFGSNSTLSTSQGNMVGNVVGTTLDATNAADSRMYSFKRLKRTIETGGHNPKKIRTSDTIPEVPTFPILVTKPGYGVLGQLGDIRYVAEKYRLPGDIASNSPESYEAYPSFYEGSAEWSIHRPVQSADAGMNWGGGFQAIAGTGAQTIAGDDTGGPVILIRK